MKKRTIKQLSLGKTKISTLTISGVTGGLPTTQQSQNCPEPIPLPNTFPAPLPLTQDTIICTLNTYTRLLSGCEC
ncbi:hypothetical protein U8527_15490 [Kordia algicida OT-1]|uniref:Uncharacterized protein n=1 Tax=Kordia algicida OT-1 TaxID=391587 RepID=A9E835_9FLAO|nr:hypothetical protein [Kordia algicida]EDP94961.1 hypothetical protein KAOT1_09109 [Kordia algicida OT-1]